MISFLKKKVNLGCNVNRVKKQYKGFLAFTLAEVLIVIGIIGIIAENTLPTLINNFEKQETLSSLREVYALLNSAIESAKVENGSDVNNWYMPTDSTTNAATYFAQTYLMPYLKISADCGASTSTECNLNEGYLSNLTSATKLYQKISGNSGLYSFTMANGAVVGIATSNLNSNSVSGCRVYIYFDVNGKRKPNIQGKDGFMIELGGNYGTGDRNKVLPYSAFSNRDALLDGSNTNSCNKVSGTGLFCFALIWIDGWQIKSDYPW